MLINLSKFLLLLNTTFENLFLLQKIMDIADSLRPFPLVCLPHCTGVTFSYS